MSPRKRKHTPATSRLELILMIGIVALAVGTIFPSISRTRDAIIIERTARCLEKCETAITFILKTDPAITNRLTLSLNAVEAAFANTNLSARVSPPNWPEEAIRTSFEPGNDGNPTINVHLRKEERTISIEDIASPHDPREQSIPPSVPPIL